MKGLSGHEYRWRRKRERHVVGALIAQLRAEGWERMGASTKMAPLLEALASLGALRRERTKLDEHSSSHENWVKSDALQAAETLVASHGEPRDQLCLEQLAYVRARSICANTTAGGNGPVIVNDLYQAMREVRGKLVFANLTKK